jgi:tetratricopeptide (TPR) repeat protein/GTPase SAR1 family protein
MLTLHRHSLLRPQLFFGRDAELAQILELIFVNIRSHPARIAILGPGGYGKTTLANAVLTHPHIREHYSSSVYMVPCESLSSPGALQVELAKTLGVFNVGMGCEDLWPQIHTSLIEKECILCLDNFESLWDQTCDIQVSIEDLLSRITQLHCVTVMITMRGTERPAGTQWTHPTLEPLKALDQDSAKEIWKCIAGNYDEYAEKLIRAVYFVPLAVNLLAHLAQSTIPMSLWEEWDNKQTGLVQRGQHPRLNLECSIQLSIDSERMRSNPWAKDLLGILSMLPDGIHRQCLNKFEQVLKDMHILSGFRVLLQCGLIQIVGERHQPHPIIRAVCKNLNFLSCQYKSSIQDLYITFALLNPYEAKAEEYDEMVLEVNNTKTILNDLLRSSHQHKPRLFDAIVTFTQFCITVGDYSDGLTSYAITLLYQPQHSTHTPALIKCLQNWGRLYYRRNDFENAKSKMKEAGELCLSSSSNESSLHASIFRNLGDIYVKQSALPEAEAAYEKALKYNEASSHSDQGNDYTKLGEIYVGLNKLEKAEAHYKRALEFHQPANNTLGQGNASLGLGNVQLRLNKLNEAEAEFYKALSLHKAANSVRSQGNDYIGLGNTYLKLKKLDQAKDSFEEALKLHKVANSVRGQANDHCGLGETYLRQNKLDDAETSFAKALELHKAANSTQGQSHANTGLKRVHKRRNIRGGQLWGQDTEA